MKTENSILQWLLDSDVSIQYQTYRDLLGEERPELRKRIETEGWGVKYLSKRNANGHWGLSFYQPKWTSTHYTLLDLRNLEINPQCKPIVETMRMILQNEKGQDGGINPSGTVNSSDLCINGMALNYGAYFKSDEEDLKSVVDFIIDHQMPDGGFNCRINRSGARHSSLHTTLAVCEGITEYTRNGYCYRLPELQKAELESREFMLQHRLFKSDKSGEIIDSRFTRLPYPSRWRYDNLRALDYFRLAGVNYDSRMDDAIEILQKKQRKDGKWPLQAKHPGRSHFEMEKAVEASKWNTLRVMRMFKHFGIK